jgi:hypothetical protein
MSTADTPPARTVDLLRERCQQLVPMPETVRYAWPAEKGPGDWAYASWFTQPLLLARRHRVVAVTDQAVHVFRTGWFRRLQPRELLYTERFSQLVVSASAAESKLELGPERLRVGRPFRRPVAELCRQLGEEIAAQPGDG